MTLRLTSLFASICAALAVTAAQAQSPLNGITGAVQQTVSGITQGVSTRSGSGVDSTNAGDDQDASRDDTNGGSNGLIDVSTGRASVSADGDEQESGNAPLPGLEGTQSDRAPVSADVRLSLGGSSDEGSDRQTSSGGSMNAEVSIASSGASGSGSGRASADGSEQRMSTSVSGGSSTQSDADRSSDDDSESEFEEAATEAEDEMEEASEDL